MFKRFTHYFACLLLVLLPLQGIAAANMSICNSIMQAQNQLQRNNQQAGAQQILVKPCHLHMAGMTNTQNFCKHNTACKSTCATLCASISGMTAIPSDIKPVSLVALTLVISLSEKNYASITQPNLQRPPISFI